MSVFSSESLAFIAVLTILSLIAFGKPSTQTGYNLDHTVTKLFTQPNSENLRYGDIGTIPEFWTWIQGHFMDTLCAEGNGSHGNDTYDDGNVTECKTVANSHLIGQVHIRQHRVVEQKCLLPNFMDRVTPHCRSMYSGSNKDTLPFGSNGTWVYSHEQFTGAERIAGRHGDYGGDGYMVMLHTQRFVTRLKKLFNY